MNISHVLRTKRVQLVITGLIVLLHASLAQAQLRDKINLPESDEKPYHIGIVIMGTQSRLQVSQHPQFLRSDSVLVTSPENTMGLGIGAFIPSA